MHLPVSPEELERELERYKKEFSEYFDPYKKREEALKEGYKDEKCEKCNAIFLAYHHWVRCDNEDCPMRTNTSLLNVLDDTTYINILDDNAFEKMTELEGQNWADYQSQNKNSRYNFFAFKKAFEEYKNQKDFTWQEYRKDLKLDVIYGEGGYARFVVNDLGIITLLANTTRQEKIDKAKQLEFKVQ